MDWSKLPPEFRLGDGPIEPELHEKMRAIGRALDEFLNGEAKGPERDIGFCLMVFQYGEKDGRCNYISNGADRKDIVSLMKEMISRFEGMPYTAGSA
jgi:hypothetical protein